MQLSKASAGIMVGEIKQMRDDFRQADFSVTVEFISGLDEHALSEVEVSGAVGIGDADLFANGSGDG